MLLSKYKRKPEAWNKHVVPYFESEATSSPADTAHHFRLIPLAAGAGLRHKASQIFLSEDMPSNSISVAFYFFIMFTRFGVDWFWCSLPYQYFCFPVWPAQGKTWYTYGQDNNFAWALHSGKDLNVDFGFYPKWLYSYYFRTLHYYKFCSYEKRLSCKWKYGENIFTLLKYLLYFGNPLLNHDCTSIWGISQGNLDLSPQTGELTAYPCCCC